MIGSHGNVLVIFVFSRARASSSWQVDRYTAARSSTDVLESVKEVSRDVAPPSRSNPWRSGEVKLGIPPRFRR